MPTETTSRFLQEYSITSLIYFNILKYYTQNTESCFIKTQTVALPRDRVCTANLSYRFNNIIKFVEQLNS